MSECKHGRNTYSFCNDCCNEINEKNASECPIDTGCSTVEVRGISDEQIKEWAKRHDLFMCGSLNDLRCMVEDAQSIHLLKP